MTDAEILEKLRAHFQTKVDNLNADEMAEGPFEDGTEFGDAWEAAAKVIDRRGGLRVRFEFADDGSVADERDLALWLHAESDWWLAQYKHDVVLWRQQVTDARGERDAAQADVKELGRENRRLQRAVDRLPWHQRDYDRARLELRKLNDAMLRKNRRIDRLSSVVAERDALQQQVGHRLQLVVAGQWLGHAADKLGDGPAVDYLKRLGEWLADGTEGDEPEPGVPEGGAR